MNLGHYRLLLKRVIWALLLIHSTKFLFYFFNLDYFSEVSFLEVIFSLAYGVRFDIATTLLVLSLFVIFSVIPYRAKWYQQFLKTIYMFSLGGALLIHLIDLEFFSFFGRKLTSDILLINNDIVDQSFQLFVNYWYLALIFALYLVISFKFYPKKIIQSRNLPFLWTPLVGFLIIIITFVGIRGGLQLKSIDVKDAFIYKEHELGNLNLHASYSFLRSFEKKKVNKVRIYKDRSRVLSIIKSKRRFDSGKYKAPNSNICILIVESLSLEYMKEGYTPFLASLLPKAFQSDMSFANGRRSIEVMPSIMVGFPSLVGTPLYQSIYQANKFVSLPFELRKNGYSTSFFHGGKTGTMEFDSYAKSIGVEKYYGLEDYEEKGHYDGQWGIFDHHFLKFFHQKINKMKKPFFTTFFTLSSHQPYSIPKEYENKFSKGELDIHESIQYADESLRLFFKGIENEPWFRETIFIITGDHTQKLKKKNNTLGRYEVPLIFYDPRVDLREFSVKEVTQHVDIMPTVLDVLNIKTESKLLFGSSVFNSDPGRMINRTSKTFIFLAENELYRYQDGMKEIKPLGQSFEQYKGSSADEFKALIQYTLNGLRGNNIYDK